MTCELKPLDHGPIALLMAREGVDSAEELQSTIVVILLSTPSDVNILGVRGVHQKSAPQTNSNAISWQFGVMSSPPSTAGSDAFPFVWALGRARRRARNHRGRGPQTGQKIASGSILGESTGGPQAGLRSASGSLLGESAGAPQTGQKSAVSCPGLDNQFAGYGTSCSFQC